MRNEGKIKSNGEQGEKIQDCSGWNGLCRAFKCRTISPAQ